MPTLDPTRVMALSRTILRATGASEQEAEQVADHLLAANLAGHDSHGIGMLPDYARLFREGLLVPDQELRVLSDAGAVLHLDAGRGFGQVMAGEAMRRGIERAKLQGAVVVGLRNSAHVGRVGAYAEQCAAAGIVSIHFCNVADHGAHQAPWGCGDARLGTNPFAAAIPSAEAPVVLDMATSAIAFGKARVARNKGLPVPPETVIDKEGRTTTDPTGLVDRREGALRSFGAHKGSGLAVFCELLGAALTGGLTMQPGHEAKGGIVNSMLSILIDPAAFGEPGLIAAEVGAVGRWIKASPPAAGFDEVLMPGEPEMRMRERRGAEGIPVDERTLADVLDAGVSLGLARAELDALLAA